MLTISIFIILPMWKVSKDSVRILIQEFTGDIKKYLY